MKKIFLLFALFTCFIAEAQYYDSTRTVQVINAYGYQYRNIFVKGAMGLPADTPRLAIRDTGAIAIIGKTAFVFWRDPVTLTYQWDSLTGSGGGGTTIIEDSTNYAYIFNAPGTGIPTFIFNGDSVKARLRINGNYTIPDSAGNYMWDDIDTAALFSDIRATIVTGGTDYNFAEDNLTFTGDRTHTLGAFRLGLYTNGTSLLEFDSASFVAYVAENNDQVFAQVYTQAHAGQPSISAFEAQYNTDQFAFVEAEAQDDSSRAFLYANGGFIKISSIAALQKVTTNLGAGTTSGGVFFTMDNSDYINTIFPIAGTTNTGSYVIAHDTTTGQFVRVRASADNISNANLTADGDHTLTLGEYELTIAGSSVNGSLLISNDDGAAIIATSTENNIFAIYGTASGTASGGLRGEGLTYGVFGTTSAGTGVYAQSTSGSGVTGFSNTSYGGNFLINPATTNTFDNVVSIGRSTSGTPANELGGAIRFALETSTTGNTDAGLIGFRWSDVTHATRTSRFEVWGVNSGTTARKLAIAGNGMLTLDGYSTSVTSGSAVYNLAVDASGNVITATIDGGIDSVVNVGGYYRLVIPNTNQIKTIVGSGGILIDTTTYANAVLIDGSGASTIPNVFSLPTSSYKSQFIIPMSAIIEVSSSYVLNNPMVWAIIQNSNHGSFGIDTVYPTSSGVVVGYAPTKYIHNLIAAPDESFSDHTVSIGSSVGLSSSTIELNRRLKAGITLTGAGTNTWTVAGNTTFASVDTFNRSNGITRYTRYTASLPGNSADALAVTNYRDRLAPPIYHGLSDSIKHLTRGSGGGGFIESFKLHYLNGQPVTAVLPTSSDVVYIDLGTYPQALAVTVHNATNQFMTTSFNIWIQAWMEAWVIATPIAGAGVVVKWQAYTTPPTNYKIYRATSKWGSRTLLYTGSLLTYTDATAVTGTHYWYFLVRDNSGVETDISYFRVTAL